MVPFNVYGLYTRSLAGEKRYFYVGKTERDIGIRIREHVRRASKGHQHLYRYLRRLDEANEAWDVEVLRTCDGSEYREDAERFEVIRLLRDRHDLQNMRYGDATHRAELARQVEDPAIRSAADVTTARLFAERCRQRRKSSSLRTRELKRALRGEGIPSALDCTYLSGLMKHRLTPGGSDASIPAGTSLTQLVALARDFQHAEKLFSNLRCFAGQPRAAIDGS